VKPRHAHTDAGKAAGKIPINLRSSRAFTFISAHKLYGRKAGSLLMSEGNSEYARHKASGSRPACPSGLHAPMPFRAVQLCAEIESNAAELRQYSGLPAACTASVCSVTSCFRCDLAISCNRLNRAQLVIRQQIVSTRSRAESPGRPSSGSHDSSRRRGKKVTSDPAFFRAPGTGPIPRCVIAMY